MGFKVQRKHEHTYLDILSILMIITDYSKRTTKKSITLPTRLHVSLKMIYFDTNYKERSH